MSWRSSKLPGPRLGGIWYALLRISRTAFVFVETPWSGHSGYWICKTHRRFLCLEEKQSGEGNNMLILFHHKTGLSSKTLQAIKFLEPNVITVPRTLIQSDSCLKVVADLGTKLKHTSGKKNFVVIWMPVLAFWVFLFFRKMVSSIVKTPSCKKEVYEHTKVLPDHLSEHKNKDFCHHPNTPMWTLQSHYHSFLETYSNQTWVIEYL